MKGFSLLKKERPDDSGLRADNYAPTQRPFRLHPPHPLCGDLRVALTLESLHKGLWCPSQRPVRHTAQSSSVWAVHRLRRRKAAGPGGSGPGDENGHFTGAVLVEHSHKALKAG